MSYSMKPRWTSRQVNFLMENCYTMKDIELADALGKTLKSVRRKRERMEMKKASGRGIVAPMGTKAESVPEVTN